jgi:hypothetical protein
MRKLTALLEQLEVISEAEKKLDAKIGNNWVWCLCFKDALLIPKLIPHFFYRKVSYAPVYSGLESMVLVEIKVTFSSL